MCSHFPVILRSNNWDIVNLLRNKHEHFHFYNEMNKSITVYLNTANLDQNGTRHK